MTAGMEAVHATLVTHDLIQRDTAPSPTYACDQCGTRARSLTDTDYGWLCATCTHRQDERSEYGYGLAASTFGFFSEDE